MIAINLIQDISVRLRNWIYEGFMDIYYTVLGSVMGSILTIVPVVSFNQG